ncbi:hypothetical protein [Ralstonia solanacearum]|uniref:hypothetical protein n=1 Tax=Ralstonia solanacearum TaxID=305 RepID=UPI0018CFEEFA|nr:hypothetical protein [Ralstonia solanacearum]
MAFFIYEMPGNSDSIFATARWASGTMISTIIAFAGLPGLFAGLKSSHLKIIDLVWVLGSAVAIVFAVIQVSQFSADETRSRISRYVETARAFAKENAAVAYQQQCVQSSGLTPDQCESLRRIGISLSVGGYLSPTTVGALCPPPINPSNQLRAFGPALANVCTQATYVARAPEEPVMKDLVNVDEWKFNSRLWPIFMISLVALRVMKSIAEVFWKVS